MTKPGFPTLGLIAKYLFDCSAVLPQKSDRIGLLDGEKDKKTFQKLLTRLSSEETELNNNLDEILELFLNYIDRITESKQITLALQCSLDDLFAEYREQIKDEGTFLSQRDSILWLIKTRFIDRAVLSIQKNMLRFNVEGLGLSVPNEKYWYLPDIQEAGIHWPLAKVFSWAYSTLDTSQTHFHFPGKCVESENLLLENNSQNASKWINGKKLPSWGGLYNNLFDSFDAMEYCLDPSYQRNISNETKKSLFTVFFIARCTTAICKDIEKHYGKEELENILIIFRQQFTALESEHLALKKAMAVVVRQLPSDDQNIVNRIWFELTPKYWYAKSGQFIEAVKSLDSLSGHTCSIGSPGPFFSDESTALAKKNHGDYIVNKYLNFINTQQSMVLPHEFVVLFFDGKALRNKPYISEDQIKSYLDKLESSKFMVALTWLFEWIKATKFYQEGSHERAHAHYEKAFLLGKYAAGSDQYKLVNQYIESCAKQNNFKAFKKGVAWANYIGIDVRWVRGMEDESEESLRAAFAMFKVANYTVL